MPLLQVQGLRTSFFIRNGVVRAVQDVSFDLERGETLGIVGESGSGKSVTCYSILGLLPQPPARIEGGKAIFDGTDLLQCSPKELRQIRGRRISMIFQDPMSSLNPYLTIGDQLIEPLRIHERLSRKEAWQRGIDALQEVGIANAVGRMRQHPHEFSGGMAQRVMIAMALITRPDLLIADEPTTALDVTVQAQILELIKERQRALGMAVILVSHDLAVVAGTCARVLVMYAGRICELGPTAEIFQHPQHPYNSALQRSIPALQVPGKPLRTIPGSPPNLLEEMPACPFAPRCEYAVDACRTIPLALTEVTARHATSCHRVQKKEIELASELAEIG